VMKAAGIPTDDLAGAVAPRVPEVQLPVNVHFNSAGWDLLGNQVSTAILGVLEPKR
jgi:hypothetical protein